MPISPTHSPQLPAPPLPILASPPATQSPPSPPSPTISPPTTPSSPSPPSPPSQTPPTSKPPPTSSPSNSSDSSPPLPKTDNGPGQSTPAMSQSSPSPVDLSHISTPGVIAIVVAGTLILLFIALCTICFFRKKKARRPQPPSLPYVLPKGTYREPANRRSWFDHASSYLSNISAKMPPPPPFTLTSRIYGGIVKPDLPSELPAMGTARACFTFEELKEATNNFSSANFLGEGGFGCVYKGELLDGQAVAVKQLRVGGRQGEREFRAEVDIISRVHHRHLVSLVGYSIAENQRLLVYEYVPNHTLEYHMHGKGRPVMNWRNRHKIAVGAARGLAYLHEDCHPRIIHRDIKSSNILLDDNFEARVSDFGLAKLFYDADTHVTTRVMGTFGYLAPEYASSGKLTEKSDVFSFGVVLLELISGLKPLDETLPGGIENLVEWGHPLLTQILEGGNLELAVDPKLNGNYDKSEMMSMVHAASACIRYSAYKRPKMSQVVRELEDGVSISDGCNNEGTRPGNSNVAYASSSYYGGRL